MAKIELNQLTAVLNEGAAVRLSSNASQTVEGETHVYFEPCEDAKAVTLSDCFTESTGRMLDVSMTLRNVCPGKRTAVGIAISEIDSAGGEHARGFRVITVPAHSGSGCCDITMPTTRFILPEELRTDSGAGMCNGRRHFVLRANSHYVDTTATF